MSPGRRRGKRRPRGSGSSVSAEKVIAFLSKPGYSPVRRRVLARALKLAHADYPAFRARLLELVRDGREPHRGAPQDAHDA